MKSFRGPQKLAELLKRQGFVEFPKGFNRDRTLYKLSKKASKSIYFNQRTIHIAESSVELDARNSLNDDEFKTILVYFSLNGKDASLLKVDNRFSINKGVEQMKKLRNELNNFKNLKVRISRKRKLERIMETYYSIELS